MWRRGTAAAALVALLVLVPPLADAVNGFLKPHDGCRVVGIVDGDTVRLLCGDGEGLVPGRIVGLDTPELSPPRCLSELTKGMAATWYLRWRLWGAGRIGAAAQGRDRYGRVLVSLALDGEEAAGALIAMGLARPYDGGRRRSWCD